MGIIKPLRYDTSHDVVMRLNDCFMRYQGKTVYVLHWGGHSLHVNLVDIRKGEKIPKVHSSDSDLDVSSLPLGYMNIQKNALYVSRIPLRKQSQGLAAINVSFMNVNPYEDGPYPNLKSANFADTVEGIYPTGDEALTKLNKDSSIRAIAFHRRYCLNNDEAGIIKLKALNKTIGWIPPGSKKIVIPERYHNVILEKTLNECHLECTT